MFGVRCSMFDVRCSMFVFPACRPNGDHGTGDEQNGSEVERAARHLAEAHPAHDAGEDELRQVGQRDHLRPQVAHAVVQRPVPDDGRDQPQRHDQADLPRPVQPRRLRTHQAERQTEDPRNQIERNHVEPDGRRASIDTAQGEVPGEEDHREQADQIADEGLAAQMEIGADQQRHAGQPEQRSDNLPARHTLAHQRPQEERQDGRRQVDQQRGVGDGRHPHRHDPRDEMKPEQNPRPCRGFQDPGADPVPVRTPVADEQRQQGNRRDQHAVRGETYRINVACLDQVGRRCAGDDAGQQNEITPQHNPPTVPASRHVRHQPARGAGQRERNSQTLPPDFRFTL